MSGAARFLENVFVILSSCFTQWKVVGEGACKGPPEASPVGEGKEAKMGTDLVQRGGRDAGLGTGWCFHNHRCASVRVLQRNRTNKIYI